MLQFNPSFNILVLTWTPRLAGMLRYYQQLLLQNINICCSDPVLLLRLPCQLFVEQLLFIIIFQQLFLKMKNKSDLLKIIFSLYSLLSPTLDPTPTLLNPLLRSWQVLNLEKVLLHLQIVIRSQLLLEHTPDHHLHQHPRHHHRHHHCHHLKHPCLRSTQFHHVPFITTLRVFDFDKNENF